MFTRWAGNFRFSLCFSSLTIVISESAALRLAFQLWFHQFLSMRRLAECEHGLGSKVCPRWPSNFQIVRLPRCWTCSIHIQRYSITKWIRNRRWTLYPFHIKPIMRSQRRFENNAVWCERSEAALFDTGVRKGAFYVGGLLLPREVFWKRILAKSRSLRRFGCQCERVHRIMRRERPNNALGWWCPSALSCSVF